MKRGTPAHPKTAMLMAELSIPRYAAVGILESLWHWTAQFAKRGDIGRYSNHIIADSVGWTDDPDKLINALVKCHWIDTYAQDTHGVRTECLPLGGEAPRLIIHDWPEHTDDSVHIALARSAETFADGTMPNMSRLNRDERLRIASIYEQKAAQNGSEKPTPKDTYAQDTHKIRTGNALPLPLPLPLLLNTRASAGSGEEIQREETPKPSSNGKSAHCKPRKPATGPNAEVIACFKTSWERKYQKELDVKDRDAVLLNRLLTKTANGDVAEAKAIISRYLASTDRFISDEFHSVAILSSKVNKFTRPNSKLFPVNSSSRIEREDF
jgi:hypothetical protein